MVIELIELSRESILKIIQPILDIEQIYQNGFDMAKAETGLENLEHCLIYANIAEEEEIGYTHIAEGEEPDNLPSLNTTDPDDSFCDIVLPRYWAAVLDKEGFHSQAGPLLPTDYSYRRILLGNTIDAYLSKWQEPYRIISHATAIENTKVCDMVEELNS